MGSVEGEVFRRGIVYGSLAVPIKKPETDHTHKWGVYVRGCNGEDISYYVKRVSFKLHESFAQPIRNLDEAPFEVNETGWGEFQIQIKITFQDPVQRPVTLNHHLRLYPPEDLGQLKTSRPVLSEFYDELIFEPATEMMAGLLKDKQGLSDPTKGPRHEEFAADEAKEIEQVQAVIEQVRAQLAEVQSKLADAPLAEPPAKRKR